MKTSSKFLLCLFYFLFGFVLHSQGYKMEEDSFTPNEIWEAGLPYVDNYTPDDYFASPNNWCIIEGIDGLIYVGNGYGVLEYDGNSWRTILLDNQSIAWTLAKSEKGKIFIGGVNEFGYLEKDSVGYNKYHSLIDNLEEKDKKFGSVWSATTLGETVFFSGDDFLFRWKDDKVKVWKPKKRFGDIFVVHNRLYVISEEVGILELKNEILVPITNNDFVLQFRNRVSILEPFEDDKMLVGIPFGGLFVYDGNDFKNISNDFLGLVDNHHIRYSSQLSNKVYAIGTLRNGLFLMDTKNSSISRKFGKNDGLLSDGVNFVYKASDGALWIASDRGVSRINTSLPLRKFNDLTGLLERVRSTTYDGLSLFAASNGVFVLTSEKSNSNFEEPLLKKIKGIDETIRHIIPIKSHKLVVGGYNLYDLDENNNVSVVTKATSEIYSYAAKSKLNSNKVFVTSVEGILYEYILDNGIWKKNIITKISEEIILVTEDNNGDLWLSTYYDGIYKLDKSEMTVNKSFLSNTLRHFDTISGLPSMEFNAAFHLDDDIYVVNLNVGLYKFNRNNQTFIKDTVLMHQYPGEISLFNTTIRDSYDNNWQPLGVGPEFRIYNIKNDLVKELPESKIFSNFMTMHGFSADSIVFFSGPQGIIAYNSNRNVPKGKLHATQIREIFVQNDSLVFAGKGGENRKNFPFNLNSMELNYSLPFYTTSEKNEYQYQLDGFDESWSSWSFDTKKYYTNIPEGDYTFKVRGKNVFGEISKEDSYSFTILPPWYRTWWAYALYVLGALLTLILFSQWRSKQLKAKNIALEKVVDERTIEIKEKNLQLENQTEKLKELDTMKTRLFANISHEFRTPLTLIKGPVEKMEESGEEKLSMTNVKMIRRNANRLLKLVNQLLDLSKLDSGKLELNAAEGDIFKCLRAAASSFSSHAAQRDIDYQINIPSRSFWASFDRDKLDKITYNLLSNAFKFTPDSGKITLDVKFRNERIQVTVADNGQGIKADKLPHIFDRFFQVDDSYTKEKAGSGIGLALTKELVDLMQGEIYVESEFEKGSVFKVVLEVAEIKSHKKQESDNYEIVHHEVVDTTLLAQTEKKAYQILIIEDNNDMRHFIREQLQDEYGILEAPNGKEGLKMATSKIPDLIITDLMMPQMDGITLCKKLKTQISTSHIPVVMLTAKAGIENKLEGLETGADDYLTKPFNAKELQVRVKNLIEERKKLRQLFGKKTTFNPAEVTVTSMDEQFLEKVIIMLENEHHNSEFGVPEMQTALGMSKTQLHRKLKALTDNPPGELLRNFRLKRAAQLLLQKGENVSQIAYAVGFNGLSYFTKCFKELYGVAPSEYTEKGNTNF